MTKIIKLEQLEKGEGNTKTSPKQPIQSKRWCFTWNNYPENAMNDIIKKLEILEAEYCIGREVGENKTPHLQGYISLKKKARWSEFGLPKEIHWEKCKGNHKENYTYCGKEGNYETNILLAKPLKCLKVEQLYDWQLEIIEIIKGQPDDRKIYWYWEPKGNMGKTTFGKYLAIKHKAIPIEGKKNDILFCASSFPSEIYIFDFERSMEDFISYAAMEKIKNGFYMSAKYESTPIIRNPPHIICFANFAPNEEMLSKDRWVIKKIKPLQCTNNNIHIL